MEYHPYPRSLYLNGDPNAAHLIVRDEDDEITARERGYKTIPEALQEKAAAEVTQKRPGRKAAA